MGVFTRTENPFGQEVDYTKYREYVRNDFRQ